MVDNNFSFFLNNQEDLFSQYPKKYILIESEKVIKVASCIRIVTERTKTWLPLFHAGGAAKSSVHRSILRKVQYN